MTTLEKLAALASGNVEKSTAKEEQKSISQASEMTTAEKLAALASGDVKTVETTTTRSASVSMAPAKTVSPTTPSGMTPFRSYESGVSKVVDTLKQEQAKKKLDLFTPIGGNGTMKSGSDLVSHQYQQDTKKLLSLEEYMGILKSEASELSKEAATDRRAAVETAQERIDKAKEIEAAEQAYKAQADKMNIQTETDWGKLLQGAVYKGSDQALGAIAKSVDWVAGLVTRGALGLTQEEYESLSPTTAFKNWVEKNAEHNRQYYAKNAQTSKAAQAVDELATATVAAVPQAVLAFVTAGQSLPATTASLTSTAASAGASGLASTVSSAVSNMARNPQYWLSFLNTAGENYESAKADGASELEASSYALLNGLVNALVEVGGGGIQELPESIRKGGGSAIREWVSSALDEGKEEVVQGIIERGFENLVYGKGNPMFSTEDVNAIINPKEMAKEFGLGTAVGGILGGGQALVQSGVNKAAEAKTPASSVELNADGLNMDTAGNLSAAAETGAKANLLKRLSDYIDRAISKSRFVNDPVITDEVVADLDLGVVAPALVEKINSEYGADISGYRHVVTDNDVRHIYNRHGPHTKEKYPVTADDLKAIPEIIENPSDVYYVRHKDGKKGLVYRYDTDVSTYYLEQIVDQENVLRNKQMIKVAPGEVPDIRGLKDAINARNTASLPGDAAQAVPQMYVPDVRRSVSTDTVAKNEPVVKNETYGGDGLGAADIGFAGESADYYDWKAMGGATQGVSPEQAANVEAQQGRAAEAIPAVNLQGRLTNRQAQTLINSGVTPDSMAETLKSALANGDFSRMAYSNEGARANAEKSIEELGWPAALARYQADVLAGKASKDITAMGITLYNNAVTSGDTYTALDIASLMIQNSSTTAQALQASRMLNKIGPDARLYMAVKSVDNIKNSIKEKYGDRAPDIKIDDGLMKEYRDALAAQDEKAAAEAWGAIEQNIADQLPSTWVDKLNAWRYLAMLGNPRTHVRNIAGNAGFMPVRLVKDAVAAGIESAVFSSGGNIQRTKSILNVASAEDRALLQTAWMDYANVKNVIQSGSKYVDEFDGVEDRRTIFKTKAIEGARKFNTKALSVEDTWFSQPAYATALAGYLKANGIDAAQFSNGNMPADARAKAQEYAVKEAQKATYRDINSFSKFVTGLKVRGDSKVAKVVNAAIEGVLPFKKTPANILVRAVEYSPLEFAQVLFSDIKNVRRGNMTAAEMIDHISSGLVGTGIMALGALLRHFGILTGGGGDDEEKKAFKEMQGQQSYALNTGDGKSYTLDWLAPGALPLFVGVEMYDALTEQHDGAWWENILAAMGNISEPMLEMSMLSGVEDLLATLSYAEGGYFSEIAKGVAQNYLLQFIPTIGGQAERSFAEEQRETTFLDRNTGISTDLQYFLGKAANKLPGVEYQQIPYIDAWGRTESSGTVAERSLENFLSPSYVSGERLTVVDPELERLHTAGYTNVLPERVSMSEQVDGVYMNADEYVAYATTRGKNSLEYITALTKNEAYAELSDEQKADVIAQLYAQAATDARNEVRAMRGGKTEEDKTEGLNAEEKAEYFLLDEAYKNVLENNAKPKKQDIDLLDSLMKSGPDTDVLSVISEKGGYEQWSNANKSGVSTRDYLTMMNATRGMTKLGDKLKAIVDTSGVSESDKLTVMKLNTTGNTPEKIQTAYDAGYSLEKIVTYKAMEGVYDSKTEQKQNYAKYGFSYNEWENLYDIFK